MNEVTPKSLIINWEAEAKSERETFDQLAVTELLEMLRRRQFGAYYSIWYSIAARSTLKEAAWALLEVLERRSIDHLYRQHCASALIQLMNTSKWQPNELSDDFADGFAERLREFKREVMRLIMREG
jgi:hypothetical protein